MKHEAADQNTRTQMRERNEKRKGREREIVRGSVRIKSIKKKVSYFPALILYFFSQFKEKRINISGPFF